MSQVSEYHVAKRRTAAGLTLTTGATVRGCFFLADGHASHTGPERIADLLNAETGFFPFETNGSASETVLINRAHLAVVRLLDDSIEAQLDPGYSVAPEREVRMRLSTGHVLEGRVRIYRPSGHDRLSDYTRAPELFRYIETDDGTFIVNSAHIVELREIDEG